MRLKMLNISEKEIQESAKRASEEADTPIMYLQNNGIKNFRWDLQDFLLWFQQATND